MSEKKLEVRVIADEWLEIVSTDNRAIVSQVLAMIVADECSNPKSPEQLLVEQLNKRLDDVQASLQSEKLKSEQLQRDLDAFKAKVAGLTANKS